MRHSLWIAPLAWVGYAAYALIGCEDGPDAPVRENGCLGEECTKIDSGNIPIGDSGTSAFPDPLEGTSKQATLLKGGYQFVETVYWAGTKLFFSDSPPDTIFELSADGATVKTFRTGANGPDGIALNFLGRLLVCEAAAHRVIRTDPADAAARTTIASQFNGKPLNSPADIVARSDGNTYFTDPDYAADEDAGGRQPKQSIFRLDPAGILSRIAEYDSNPTGVALSPNEGTLYVADTDANLVRKFSLAENGEASNETVFVPMSSQPDGLTTDDAGNLYVGTTGGVDVFDPSARKLGTILVTGRANGVSFGGADRRTLYIGANSGSGNAATGVYSIKLNVPGLP